MRLAAPESVFAPACAGQEAGEAVFLLNGWEVGRVKLCYGETVAALPRQNDGEMCIRDRLFILQNHRRRNSVQQSI